jgi:hypothetical protein
MHGNVFIIKTEDSLTEEGKKSQPSLPWIPIPYQGMGQAFIGMVNKALSFRRSLSRKYREGRIPSLLTTPLNVPRRVNRKQEPIVPPLSF